MRERSRHAPCPGPRPRAGAAPLSVASPAILLAFVLAALSGLVWWPSPARAIETSVFGIEPAERSTTVSGLPLEVRAGEATETAVRLWNKTEEAVTLTLRAAPARLGPEGTPVLGGDSETAEWVRIDQEVVRLGAHESRVIALRVEAPRSVPERASAAVVARPGVASGAGQAVLQEVGLVLRMTRVGPASAPADPAVPADPAILAASGGSGTTAAVAALLALGLATEGLRRVHRRRSAGADVGAPPTLLLGGGSPG